MEHNTRTARPPEGSNVVHLVEARLGRAPQGRKEPTVRPVSPSFGSGWYHDAEIAKDRGGKVSA